MTGRPASSDTTSALALWRTELQAGHRSRADYDLLWRAAAAESLADEHRVAGLQDIADQYAADAVTFLARHREGSGAPAKPARARRAAHPTSWLQRHAAGASRYL
jgi:hypothetical protein